MIMGCTYKKQNSMFELSASFGSQVCVNMAIPEIVALRDRLVGTVYPVELMMERARGLGSAEAQAVDVPQLAAINPYVATGKKFRCMVVIEGLQRNQGWWYLACDTCSCKALEEGTAYRCTNEKCGGRGAGPRFRLSVVASGDGASVEMAFFGDTARDLVGKPADVLVAENCTLFSSVPPEIAALTGRKYVVDVSVSRYSFRSKEIRFQVLKFYPEGSSVFVGMAGSDAALAEASGEKPASSAKMVPDLAVQALAKGSGKDTVDGVAPSASSEVVLQSTPPPAVSGDAPKAVDAGDVAAACPAEFEAPLGGPSEKREPGVKRQLFSEGAGKAEKKVAKKGR